MAKKRLGIVVTRFHEDITGRMEQFARAKADEIGMEVEEVAYAPGTFDAPLVALRLIKKHNIDAVAVLGTVLKGETDHDVVVANSTAVLLQRMAVRFEKPITLGIIGPNAKKRMADERAQEYAERAVEAAFDLVTGKSASKPGSHKAY